MKSFNYIDALYIVIEYCYWHNTLNADIEHIAISFEDVPRRAKLLREVAKRWDNKPTKRKVFLLKKYESRLKPVY